MRCPYGFDETDEEKMDVATFKGKLVESMFDAIDAAIDKFDEFERSSFVVSFKDGSQFEVHICEK